MLFNYVFASLVFLLFTFSIRTFSSFTFANELPTRPSLLSSDNLFWEVLGEVGCSPGEMEAFRCTLMVLLLIPSLYSGGGGEGGIQITAHLQLFVVVVTVS